VFWACARTEVQREAVAERHLALAGFATYVPRIRVERHVARANGHAVSSTEAPLFPSYIFVSILDQWHAITTSIGVAALIMSDGHPAPLPDRVIDELRGRENGNGLIVLPRPPQFERGDRVRIIRGALAGQLAIFAHMKPRERVEVLLAFLGGERPLMLPRRDVVRA
jgi:transcriptional antiterminator RfaH